MKHILHHISIILFVVCTTSVAAQTDTTNKSSGRHSLEISNNGIKYTDKEKEEAGIHSSLHFKMHIDIGFNNVVDHTAYSQVPIGYLQNPFASSVSLPSNGPLNANHLKLNAGKSINVNLWPLWFSQDIVKHNVQLESGLGFQFFNYRFESLVKHSDQFLTNNSSITSTTSEVRFEEITNPTMLIGKAKNKLGISYISVPLMLRFNTTEKKGRADLTFAFGVIGSYKLKSWTKFYGEKNSGDYDIKDWMTQLTAEIGIPGIIKFYGTYALQPMYNNTYIDRTPFAIGVRF